MLRELKGENQFYDDLIKEKGGEEPESLPPFTEPISD